MHYNIDAHNMHNIEIICPYIFVSNLQMNNTCIMSNKFLCTDILLSLKIFNSVKERENDISQNN